LNDFQLPEVNLETADQAAIRSLNTKRTIRAKALHGAGILAWAQGDYARAQAAHTESLVLFRELGNKAGIAQTLNTMGVIARRQKDYTQAYTWCMESLALYRDLGDKIGVARVLNNLGVVALDQQDYSQAQTFYEESLALVRESGDRRSIAVLLGNLGEIGLRQEDYTRAHASFIESLALRRDLGDKEGIAHCLEGLAQIAGACGQPQRAAQMWGAAEALREALGASTPPAERAAYERAIAAAHTQIDAAAWDAAWAAGRTLALEQAIAEAGAVAAAQGTRGGRRTRPLPIPAAPAGPRLVLATADGTHTIALDRMPLTIGRDAASDILLADSRVSRQHARLSYRKPHIWLTDLGAMNGTYVNGERIEARALRDGDTLSFGGLEVTFRDEAGG
jgi:tetratricopeptide (TPR) repeat protein